LKAGKEKKPHERNIGMKKICIVLAYCFSAGHLMGMALTKTIDGESYAITSIKRKMLYDDDYNPVNWAYPLRAKISRVHRIQASIPHQTGYSEDSCKQCTLYKKKTDKQLDYLSDLCNRLVTATAQLVSNLAVDAYMYESNPNFRTRAELESKMHDAIDRYNALVDVTVDKRLLEIRAHIEIIRNILEDTQVGEGSLEAEIRASLRDL